MAAKKGFSERAWEEIINGGMDGAWIDGEIASAKESPDDPFADTGPLLAGMLKKGVTKEEICRLARAVRYEAVFAAVQLAAEEGLDGEQLDGVHEELLMADPSGKEGRPGSWPVVAEGKKGGKKGKGEKKAADPDAPLLNLPKADDFAFSPDGSRLWLGQTSTNATTVRGVAIPGGEQFVEFNALPNLRGLACSPDGKRLAASNHGGAVALYDAATGKELWKTPKTNEETSHLAYAPDGSMVLNSGSEPFVRRRDAKTGKELPGLDVGGEGWLAGEMAFSPDGKVLAVMAVKVAEKDADQPRGFLTCWDWRAGKELRRFELPDAWGESMAFMPDGRAIAMLSSGEVSFWDSKTHKKLDGTRVAKDAKSADVHASEMMAAVDTYDEGSQIVDLVSGKVLKKLETEKLYPTAWAFSPDGKYVLLVAKKSFLWDVDALLGRR